MIKKVPAFKLLLLGSLCIGADNLMDAKAQASVRTISYIEHSPTYQNYKSKTIAALLTDSRKLFNVDFVYESGILPNKEVVIDPGNYKTVDDFLHALLKSTGLKYKMVLSRTYVIYRNEADLKSLVSLLQQKDNFQNSITAQSEITVTGTITDQTTGTGLEGVSVVVKGSSKGTVTGKNGAFSIMVDNETSILVFSLVGYQSKEVTVGSKNSIQIALISQPSAMNEVVVVGYGAQKKSLVTGAISSIKAEELSSSSSSRVEQALQGRTAGVTVLPASGSPGSGMNVRIRGAGSNGSSQPLYIIDGVRAGGIEYLDPSEIASVEVLKDAASAAIYGAEGANGVVIITTKTGKRNTSDITYSTQYGQQSVKKDLMAMMNAQQYQEYLEAANAPIRPSATDVAGIKGTNWFNEVFQNAPLMRHSLAFSGGSEKSTYLIDGTYFSQEGIVGGDQSKFTRYTLRINTDHKIKPWLNVGEKLSYAHFKRNGVEEDDEFNSVLSSALVMDPLTPVTYTGTLPTFVQNAITAGHPLVKDGNGNYFGLSQYVLGEYANPLARIHSTHGSTVQNKVVGNLYADIEPIKGLKFTSRFGIDAAFQREHGWTPTYWYSSEKLNTVAGGYDWGNNWFTWQWENFANYQRKIGDHNFTVLAGTSAVKRMWNYLGGTFSGLFKEEDRFSYADFVPNTQDRIASNATVSSLASYYGRLSYDFKSKYLVNATVRRDGSSLLSTNNQWQTYPSVSLGWVLSNEKFYPAGLSDIMNSVKLRASWGQNGSIANVLIGQWQAAITTQNIRYPDANGNYLIGAAPSNLENRDLKWETSEQIDLGADLSFLKSRLLFTVDYYKKTTKDLLTPGTAPLFVGNVLTIVNGGNVENKGWEFELSYRDKTGGGFKYEVAANLTSLHNEVTYLDPNVSEILGAGIGTGWTATAFKLGNPIWYFRGYKTEGIFQTQDDVTKYLSATGITGYSPKPGEPIVVDVNGDKQISVADQTYIGSPHPKFIYGGRVNLAYKGFDFIAFIQGQSGNEILMGFNRIDRPTANKPSFFYNNRWTGAGSTNTWFAPNTSNAYIYNSDLMIFNGSYARIRQLQLGYTLPVQLAGKLKTKAARVYVSLDDFFTFTSYPGLDPEAGSGDANSLGIDRGVYPIPRKVLAGLSITF